MTLFFFREDIEECALVGYSESYFVKVLRKTQLERYQQQQQTKVEEIGA